MAKGMDKISRSTGLSFGILLVYFKRKKMALDLCT